MDLAELIQKQAFYQAGGKDPGTDTLDKINASTEIIGKTIKDVLAIKKLALQNREAERENTTYETLYNVPSKADVGVAQQRNANINANQVPQNIYPQAQPQGAQRLMAPPPAPIPFTDPRQARLNELRAGGINISEPMLAQTPATLKTQAQTQYMLAGVPQREAQTEKISSDPMRKSMGELFPTMDDQTMASMFGPGISRQTPYSVAYGMGKLKVQSDRAGKMFPVAALSPEGQAAAMAAGLSDYIPESTARIINGANPIKLPSFEETTSLATARSIEEKIGKVYQALPAVGNQALGFGSYQINKYGQYIPGVTSDPSIVDFYTNINSINNAMIYYMSGKQINEQEASRIKAELLEPEMNPDAFTQRLATVMANFDYLRNLKDRAVSGTGKRNPFEQGNPPPSAPQSDSQLAPEDQEALDWANANPSDPRSAAIKQQLGQR